MPVHICVTCGTSFPDETAAPSTCPICDEERQYVPASGQRWTTPDALALTHSNAWRLLEPDLFELQTYPAFGIGQRAFLVRTPAGNVLWDCIALIDDATKALVASLGGIQAIAISHPHYYTRMQDWADAFGAPVYIHARDREWVMRGHDRLAFWEGEERELLPGLTMLRLGGHFPGGAVMHWREAAAGRGVLLSGDIVQVAPSRKTVSFMWSFPNWLPLSPDTVDGIARRLAPWPFERVYGAFGRHILADGASIVQASARRYRELIETPQA